MPNTVNKQGYWLDPMLDRFMRMMENVNTGTDAQAHVSTPVPKMNPRDVNAWGPEGIPQPGVVPLPYGDITELILQMGKK